MRLLWLPALLSTSENPAPFFKLCSLFAGHRQFVALEPTTGTEDELHNDDDVWLRAMPTRSIAAIADVITEEGSPIATFAEEDNRSFQSPCVPDAEGSLAQVPVIPVIRVPVEDIEKVPREQIAAQNSAKDFAVSGSPKMLSKLFPLCLYFFQVVVQCQYFLL